VIEKISLQNLRNFSLLRGLAEEDLYKIKDNLFSKTVRKDEILLLEGEVSNQLIFVEKGWFKSEKISKEGRQQTLRFIGPWEVINEYAVFSEEPNAASFVAMEDARVLYLQKSEVETLLTISPKFSRAVITNLAKRIHHLLDHVENLSLFSVEQRLAQYLLKEEIEGVIKRQSWKTQAEIAAQLGTVVDVINRILQKFEKQGIIAISRDKFTILDKSLLKNIIDKND